MLLINKFLKKIKLYLKQFIDKITYFQKLENKNLEILKIK